MAFLLSYAESRFIKRRMWVEPGQDGELKASSI
jgi:hypothetical protein